LQVGYSPESRDAAVVPIRQCKLAHHELETALAELQAVVADYRGGSPDKLPARIQLHATAEGAGALVVFPVRIHGSQRKLWRNWLAPVNLPGGIWFATGNRAGVLNANSWLEPDEGAAPLLTTWKNEQVKVHPGAFCQANAAAAELVHRKLADWAAFSHGATVWDLYGGYGALGFAAAMRGSRVRILEATKWSEPAAARLAELTGNEYEFVRGDVLKEFRARLKEVRDEDLLLLDPPRSGAHPDVLESILRSKAQRIAYLSCNPAKLGRDLTILTRGGFRVTEVQPYDFFPQTAAMEVLALVER
jgi:23S rRNA (uracil1939-C5)-methyltransferase